MKTKKQKSRYSIQPHTWGSGWWVSDTITGEGVEWGMEYLEARNLVYKLEQAAHAAR